MSLTEATKRTITDWIWMENDRVLLANEIEHYQRHKALLQGDLEAGDVELCGGDAQECRNGIDYCDAVLAKLIKQGQRLDRSNVPPHPRPIALDDIKRRIQVANTIEAFQVLSKVTGTWPRLGPRDEWWMRCPLPGHEDKTPSFHMNEDGRWFCFGCQRGGGDKVSFVAAYLVGSQVQGLLLLESMFPHIGGPMTS